MESFRANVGSVDENMSTDDIAHLMPPSEEAKLIGRWEGLARMSINVHRERGLELHAVHPLSCFSGYMVARGESKIGEMKDLLNSFDHLFGVTQTLYDNIGRSVLSHLFTPASPGAAPPSRARYTCYPIQ